MIGADWQAAADWLATATELDAQGCARMPGLLTPGVSTVRSGHRYALGLVFHDA